MDPVITKFEIEKLRIPVSNKKGSNGVLLIIGGSDLYTGAPYFVSKAAFLTGTELVYIINCGPKNSIIPLKILSPESIVMAIDDFEIEKYDFILKRACSVVFGSGLSRPNERVTSKIESILVQLQKCPKNPKFIIDGDGIYFLNKYPHMIKSHIILTPNLNELKYIEKIRKQGDIVLKKGSIDIIEIDEEVIRIGIPNGNRRCAGLGDICVGILSSLLNFYKRKDAVVIASILLRECTGRAFSKKKFSFLPANVLEELSFIIADNVE